MEFNTSYCVRMRMLRYILSETSYRYVYTCIHINPTRRRAVRYTDNVILHRNK